jgi:hypothetical protein
MLDAGISHSFEYSKSCVRTKTMTQELGIGNTHLSGRIDN